MPSGLQFIMQIYSFDEVYMIFARGVSKEFINIIETSLLMAIYRG